MPEPETVTYSVPPPGMDCLTYDPRRAYALAVPKDLHGVLVIAGDTVRTLDDATCDRNGVAQNMTTVERAVLAARFRAWADLLETPRG